MSYHILLKNERVDKMLRAGSLRQKEVININDAARLGYVADVEVNLKCGELEAIIVPGKMRLFHFGKCEDLVITWNQIFKIGEDVILVDIPCVPKPPKPDLSIHK